MSKLPSLSNIVTTTLHNHSGALADNLARNHKYFLKIQRSYEIGQIWKKATDNMPWQRSDHSHYKRNDQIKALAECLNIHPQYVGRALRKGHEDELETKLRGYAGHYGTQLAAIRLANLGIIDQYPHWPPP